MSTPSARTGGSLDAWFKISARGSTVRQEIVAGLTTFLAMVYSVIVVPGMLGKAGFPPAAVFVSTCLVAGVGWRWRWDYGRICRWRSVALSR